MKFFIFLIICIAASTFISCMTTSMTTTPIRTEADLQQLEKSKNLFTSQLENDMHPIIWAYLGEVLHDPDSFRLQRFEYTLINYSRNVPYEHKLYWFGDQTETRHKEVIVPAYHIHMRYRVRIPAGGIMLKEMSFYLLKDKELVLPNNDAVTLVE